MLPNVGVETGIHGRIHAAIREAPEVNRGSEFTLEELKRCVKAPEKWEGAWCGWY